MDFGNGHVGLLYESDGLGYMAIPNGKKFPPTELSVNENAEEL